MHTTKRLWGLGLIAILVAACSTTGGNASPASPTVESAPPVTQAPASQAASPSAEADICTAAEHPDAMFAICVPQIPGIAVSGTDYGGCLKQL